MWEYPDKLHYHISEIGRQLHYHHLAKGQRENILWVEDMISREWLQALICQTFWLIKPIPYNIPILLFFRGGRIELPPLLSLNPEPRKHTILPRNHDNFSKASYFFSEEFYTLWSFSPKIGGTHHFRSSFFHPFVFNLWKKSSRI